MGTSFHTVKRLVRGDRGTAAADSAAAARGSNL